MTRGGTEGSRFTAAGVSDVRLLDFGCSASSDGTYVDGLIGTTGYIAPEVVPSPHQSASPACAAGCSGGTSWKRSCGLALGCSGRAIVAPTHPLAVRAEVHREVRCLGGRRDLVRHPGESIG